MDILDNKSPQVSSFFTALDEHPELPARRPALKISILQFQHIQKILFHKLVILSGNT